MIRTMLAKTVGGLLVAACSNSSAADARHQPPPTATELAAATEDVKAFAGEFTFSGGEAEREAMRQAVEDAVAEMNPLIRGIARDRLLASNAIPDAAKVHPEGDVVTIGFDDREYTASLGAGPIEVVGSSGDPLKLTHRLTGGKLVQDFVGDKGGRTNTLGVGGETLTVDVRVHSTKLPKDVTYRMTFTRG